MTRDFKDVHMSLIKRSEQALIKQGKTVKTKQNLREEKM